jgi:hypothetical protein
LTLILASCTIEIEEEESVVEEEEEEATYTSISKRLVNLCPQGTSPFVLCGAKHNGY